MSFESLGLEPRLLSAVDKMGYTDPTPIQREAIPHVLAGRDVVGVAQTGTGKTAAFVLPMLQRTPTKRGIRALVVTPTRELAHPDRRGDPRASRVRRTTAPSPSSAAWASSPRSTKLRRGVDIVIACPGRLLDLHSPGRGRPLARSRPSCSTRPTACSTWASGPTCAASSSYVPQKRQNLLFSATMAPEVIKVVDSVLTDPVRVEVSPPAKPVERIEQTVYPVCNTQKTDLLVEMLKRDERRFAHAGLHAHQASRRPRQPPALQARRAQRGHPRRPLAEPARACARVVPLGSLTRARRDRCRWPAASTSTRSRTSSTTTCPTPPRTTCTASAGRRAPGAEGSAISFLVCRGAREAHGHRAAPRHRARMRGPRGLPLQGARVPDAERTARPHKPKGGSGKSRRGGRSRNRSRSRGGNGGGNRQGGQGQRAS